MKQLNNNGTGSQITNPGQGSVGNFNPYANSGYSDNGSYEGEELNKARLLRDNWIYAREDAYQQYQSRKKSILVAYLIFYFTFFVFANFYAGRKRLAMIQLTSLLITFFIIVISLATDAPQGLTHFLDGLIMLVFSCFWLFDLCTLWVAVRHYNSRLYSAIFDRTSNSTGNTGTSIVKTNSGSQMPTTFEQKPFSLRKFSDSIKKY